MSTSFYVDRASRVHALNPVTKLMAGFALIIVGFSIPDPWWVPVALFLGAIFPAALVGGVHQPFGRMLIRFLLPFVIMLFLVQSAFFPGGVDVLFSIGPLGIEREGVTFAAQTAARLLVLVGVFSVLLLTTHPGRLMAALVQRGMSPKISYAVSATLQIIPDFQRRADAIIQAQRARGLSTEGSRRRRIRALVPLVAPLLLGAFNQVGDRAVALEARAFTVAGPKTNLVVIPDSRTQRIVRWALVVLAIAVVALRWV